MLAQPRKVALVTGAGIRIGAAIATALCEHGHTVWIHCGRSTTEAHALAATLRERHGEDAIAGVVPADLREPSERAALVAEVLDPASTTGGRLDVLVNNAASFERGEFLSRTDAELERVLQLNLVAPLSLVRSCAAALARAESGCVVNIVDVHGLVPVAGYLDHCVAKAGLELATRALAVELAPVRVNAVAPGTVEWPTDPRFDRPELREAVVRRIPLGRIGTREDVAGAVLYLVGARHTSGHCLVVDGGRMAAAGA